uniref:Nuclear pore complex protein Nup98-Nup96 n=1 Tax=Panagrellus redivivus TaxID=6233 RepID=A0A7E4VB27_PANRE
MANPVLIVGGPEGTPIPFEARRGYDAMVVNGETKNVSVKYVCITDMLQYMGRSIEELRIFDYMFNRKGGGDASTKPMTNPGSGPSVPPTTVFAPSAPLMNAYGPSPGWMKMEFWVYGYPASPAFGPPVQIQPQRPLFCSSGSPRRSFWETPGAKPAASSGTFGSIATKTLPFAQTTQSGGLFGDKAPLQAPTQPAVNPLLASTPQPDQQKPLCASHETTKEPSLFAFPDPDLSNDSGFNFDSTVTSTSPAKAPTNDDSQQPVNDPSSLNLDVLDHIIDFTKDLLANETLNSDPCILEYVTKMTETLSLTHDKSTPPGGNSINPLDKDYNLPD